MSVKPGLQTIDDLLALPDDSKRYELHDGAIVEVGYSSRDVSRVGVQIIMLLYNHMERVGLRGDLTDANCTFALDDLNTRIPNTAYITSEKTAPLPHDAAYYPFAPDLAVEIKSPSNSDSDMRKLAALYLRTGSRLVWAVDYEMREIRVHRPGHEALVVSGDGVLDGYDVLPGLKIRVADIFKVLDA